MSTKDFVILIWGNLMRRKGRVALTSIGVVVGTASILILVSLITTLKDNAAQSIFGISEMKKIQVSPGYGESNEEDEDFFYGGVSYDDSGNERTPTVPITQRSVDYFSSIPNVVSVMPMDRVEGYGTLTYKKTESWAEVMGVVSSNLSGMGLVASAGNLNLTSGTIVLGASLPEDFIERDNNRPGDTHALPSNLLGEKISFIIIKYTPDGYEERKVIHLRVIGILKEDDSENDWQAFISMSDAQTLNQWYTGKRINRDRSGYQQAIILVEDSKQTLSVSKEISEKGYKTYTAQSFVKGINSFFLVLQIIFGGIGAISLFVAAIGISNTMTMAILERTREIGLMKAIGATNQDVLTIFLGEAGGIGFLGGIGGALLGWSANFIIGLGAKNVLSSGEGGNSFVTHTSSGAILFIIAFSTFIGILSGIYPALHAATLVPVEALKTE